jgi:hypothetical protein
VSYCYIAQPRLKVNYIVAIQMTLKLFLRKCLFDIRLSLDAASKLSSFRAQSVLPAASGTHNTPGGSVREVERRENHSTDERYYSDRTVSEIHSAGDIVSVGMKPPRQHVLSLNRA